MTNETPQPTNVGSNDQLGLVAGALKRAYYYTDLGGWRGPEVDDAERWLAVAQAAQDAGRAKAFQDAARWVDEEMGHAIQDGWSPEAVQALMATRDMLKAHAEMRATTVEVAPPAAKPVYCWLVELFEGDGTGNSAGWYHTGFTDIGGYSRTTKNPHEARRYFNQEHAERVAIDLGTTLTGTWRAVEHGFEA